MTRPLDHWDAGRPALGKCACCHLDLDEHFDVPVVSYSDGTHECEACSRGECDHAPAIAADLAEFDRIGRSIPFTIAVIAVIGLLFAFTDPVVAGVVTILILAALCVRVLEA